MPRYFFHTADGGVHRDDEGTELPDDNAARVAAIRYAGELLNDRPEVLWDGRDFRVEVRQEDSSVVTTVIALAVNAVVGNADD